MTTPPDARDTAPPGDAVPPGDALPIRGTAPISDARPAGEAAPAFDERQPFTLRQGLEAGISHKRLRGPRYRRLLHNVYVAARAPVTPSLMARATLVGYDESAYVSHTSAAAVLGIPIKPGCSHVVTVPTERQRRQVTGVRCVVRRGRARTFDGVRISTSAQLFAELAEQLAFVELVVAGDHMLRLGLTSWDAIRQECRMSAAPGVGRALAAVPYLSARAESPQETRLRMLIVLAGLPRPVVNYSVRAASGREIRRHDLAYPEARVAIEYEGAHHIDRARTWEKDIRREEDSQLDGWLVIRVTSRGIHREPEVTLARIVAALASRGVRTGPLDPRWRLHFN